jgi:branched-subunit amino acid transport protein
MTVHEGLLISGMALVTLLIRYPVIAMSGRLRLSERLLQALNYVPPAVLTAIVVPAIFVDGDRLWWGWDNPRLIGAIAALGIGLWQRNLLLTIVVGMGAFLLWKTLLSSV